MQGRRREDRTVQTYGEQLNELYDGFVAGDYSLVYVEEWDQKALLFLDPNGVRGCITERDGFEFTQETDGSISVNLPLLHNGEPGGWSGAIQQGEWQECSPEDFSALSAFNTNML